MTLNEEGFYEVYYTDDVEFVALTLNEEGFYEVYYTDDVEFQDLCVMSTLLQSAALDALGGTDEDDEE